MAIAETSRRSQVSLQQLEHQPLIFSRCGGQSRPGHTSAMKNPMSNIAFGMAAATLSNGNIRDVILNAPAPR
jgi:hypothetical protein